MKLANTGRQGALAVRFYQSVLGPFPIEVGAAAQGASLSAIVRPAVELACADSLDEEGMGVSLLEAEATGLAPEKLCEQLNAFFAGARVDCLSVDECSAMTLLFCVCNMEPEFELGMLDSGRLRCTRLDDRLPETLARDMFVMVNTSGAPARA